MTTKIHALVDALGNPVNLMLTPGQDHDLTCALPLLENTDPGALLADKAYDADPLIEKRPPCASFVAVHESGFWRYPEGLGPVFS